MNLADIEINEASKYRLKLRISYTEENMYVVVLTNLSEYKTHILAKNRLCYPMIPIRNEFAKKLKELYPNLNLNHDKKIERNLA